jgi:hypothetical protein
MKVSFLSSFKSAYQKEIWVNFRSYQLSERFGGAQMFVISPSYILVNLSGENIRITNLPGSKDYTDVENGKMVKIDFRAHQDLLKKPKGRYVSEENSKNKPRIKK